MILCEICGVKAHSIRHHIRDGHNDTSWTLTKYKEEFPGAPLLSAEAEEVILKAKQSEESKKAAKESVSTLKDESEKVESVSVAPTGGIKTLKRAMKTAFSLGNIKAAKSTRTGLDIMVTCLDRSTVKEPSFIPDHDPGYIFDIEVLKTLLMGIEFNIPTYLYGHAGLGKSSIFEQIAAATDRPIRRVQHTVNTEESHIVGQYVVNQVIDPVSGELKAKTEFQLGDLPIAMMNGEIFMADEYDRAYPSVLSVYQAVLEGKPLHIKEAPEELRLIRPHPEFRFVATGNTNGSGDSTGLYQATVTQDAATFERFGVVEEITYMPEKQEIAILESKTNVVNEDAVKIVKFANKIRHEAYPDSVSLTLGPRVLLNAARIGLGKFDLKAGIKIAYANRLPEIERKAAMDLAQRYFG